VEVSGVSGPLVAFIAGVVSFLSPCVLPLVPVYLLQMAGTSTGAYGSRRFTFAHAVSFVIGFSIVFVVLGASVGLMGYALQDNIRTFTRIAGVILIVFGLHLTGIIRIPWLARTYQVDVARAKQRTYAGSALIGASFSLGWTPCVGPVLGGILTLAASSSTVAQGALLLAFYSAGLGIPFLIAGLLAAEASAALKRFNRFLPTIELASGGLLVLAGILIFTDRFTIFNQTFDSLGISQFGVL
jgi:cytochrome c-type biogenesis protein